MDEIKGIEEAISKLSGKWTVKVLYSVKRNPKTFTDIKKEIGGISNKMLSKTLSKLEEEKIVTKAESVDGYIITDKGKELKDSIKPLRKWSEKHKVSENQVLVVEDDQNQADLYSNWLERYNVKKKKIDELHEENQDKTIALLLDRDLEGKSFRKYLKHLDTSEIPVIMITGLEPSLEIADIEIQDYIVKPVSKETIRQKIQEMEDLKQKTRKQRKIKSLQSRKQILESRLPNKKLEESSKYKDLNKKLKELKDQL